MSTATSEEPHLIPATRAAGQLGRHEVTLRKDLREGRVPGVRIGGRWFLSSTVLARILAGELDPGGDA